MFGRVLSITVNIVFKRFLLSIIRTTIITLLLAHLPTSCHYVTTLGKDDKKKVK